MEGNACSEPGCSIHDFLPFICARCAGVYCLDHRSRFTHSCRSEDDNYNNNDASEAADSKSTPTKVAVSYKGMIKDIENRFDAQDKSSSTQHYRIQSSSSSTPSMANAKSHSSFEKSMARLQNLAKSGSSTEKTRRVSEVARRVLVKNRAKGNDNCLEELRLYLVLHFCSDSSDLSSSNSLEYAFFSGTATLAEVLQQIKKIYARVIPSRYEDYSLVLFTEDSPDWQSWDRNTPIGELLGQCEPVFIAAIPSVELIRHTQSLFAKQQQEAATQKVTSVIQPNKAFVKGDIAWYHKSKSGAPMKSKQDALSCGVPLLLVKIVGVHHDDFPNIYYTINMVHPSHTCGTAGALEALSFHDEKQTDSDRLIPVLEGDVEIRDALKNEPEQSAYGKSPVASSISNETKILMNELCVTGPVLSFKVSHGGVDYNDMRISSKCRVSHLKQLLSVLTGIPVKNLKVIIKGSILKQDSLLVTEAKLANGMKITVIG